jgi:hypothetical protein
MIINIQYIGIHITYSLFLSDFKESLIFSTDFGKILEHEISWKSVPWESSCSMRLDGQTHSYDEANSRSTQFCNRAYNPILTQHLKFLLVPGIQYTGRRATYDVSR